MRLCRELGALYIDTVVEPWPGFYFDKGAGPEARTNNALRETVREEKAKNPGGIDRRSPAAAPIPAWCRGSSSRRCSTSPRDTGHAFTEPGPDDREGWARLMRDLGVKGIHIAERDTQRARNPKPMGVFVNTWSVEGFLSEGMQPAELGWGTHEKWMPENGRLADDRLEGRRLPAPARRQHPRPLVVPDAGAAIRLPRHPQRVDLDRRLLHRPRGRQVVYRPTCHYAYHPANDAVLSLRRAVRPRRQDAGRAPHPRRERDRRRHRRARRAPLRPREERLLVRLAALDRGDARPRALPERHRPAGDLGGARRHGLGAGEPGRRHRRGRRDGLPPLPRRAASLSRAGQGLSTPTGRRSPTVPGFFPEDIDASDPWQFRNVLVR